MKEEIDNKLSFLDMTIMKQQRGMEISFTEDPQVQPA